MRQQKKLLFHGSKALFKEFDPEYALTGEGVSSFKGWYFIDSLKGAFYHVDSRLKDIQGPGFIYVCLVPIEYIVENIEFTDGHYHGSSVGVNYGDSSTIEIIEVLETEFLFEEVVGSPKKYILETTKARLNGGWSSYLRRA